MPAVATPMPSQKICSLLTCHSAQSYYEATSASFSLQTQLMELKDAAAGDGEGGSLLDFHQCNYIAVPGKAPAVACFATTGA